MTDPITPGDARRSICPVCKRGPFLVRSDGTMGRHGHIGRGLDKTAPCPGSGQKPEQFPPDPITPGDDEAAYREQAEALIADLRARVAHYEALAVAARDEALTKAALAVDFLVTNVRGFDESWDRGYCQGVQDSAYFVRELRGGPKP